jgi:hypothetical protein
MNGTIESSLECKRFAGYEKLGERARESLPQHHLYPTQPKTGLEWVPFFLYYRPGGPFKPGFGLSGVQVLSGLNSLGKLRS